MTPGIPGLSLALILGTTAPHAPAAPRDENAFPVVLGSFATTLVGSLPDRTANIRLCASALDGVELGPGDELSFNRVVGPRTTAAGYRTAPVILREARDFQLGGGICQVSTTLFVAALLAGLEPAERHRHSSPVDYVALGQDATVSWGAKDLRVRNPLEQRVRLRVEVVGTTLAARLEGEEPGEGRFELATEERALPETSAGGAPGREIELFRVHLIDDVEIGREMVHRDVYPARAARREASSR